MNANDLNAAKITVSTQALKREAEELTSRLRALEVLFERFGQEVNATRSYWTGQAADAHRKVYQARSEDFRQALQRLRNYPINILTIAGVYENTEKDLADSFSVLGTNVIS